MPFGQLSEKCRPIAVEEIRVDHTGMNRSAPEAVGSVAVSQCHGEKHLGQLRLAIGGHGVVASRVYAGDGRKVIEGSGCTILAGERGDADHLLPIGACDHR